jgi:predicted nucleic acid-binding protein
VVVKWQFPSEPHGPEAEELRLDWRHQAVDVHAPQILLAEVASSCLRAHRRGRLTETEATNAIQLLLGLPFVLHEMTTPLLLRAFQIAQRYNQPAFDCIYVALAEQEGSELWTGDQRLNNALRLPFPFVRSIADYQRKRP